MGTGARDGVCGRCSFPRGQLYLARRSGTGLSGIDSDVPRGEVALCAAHEPGASGAPAVQAGLLALARWGTVRDPRRSAVVRLGLDLEGAELCRPAFGELGTRL